ncbi:MAG: hypothetical protein Q7S87_08800 [Agitococcus sp.]|nr:hypothetical protein [Agitococcus sp.]MDO9176997.1 hypothetical protein [Agitococcus sp.]
MLPICAKKLMLNNSVAILVASLCCVAASSTAAATKTKPKTIAASTDQSTVAIAGVVSVSDFELNTFVFSDPVKRIFFPAGSAVKGAPIYLQENTQVMLQFDKGQKPIQMVAELANGGTEAIRVQPKAIPGVVHAVNGARSSRTGSKRIVAQDSTSPASPRAEDIELLKKLAATGEAPSGFDPISLPRPTRFDKFTVVPLAGWSDGATKRIIVFSLVAAQGQTAVVSPPQFYRQGISAVVVDGDVVDNANSPQLYVVEDLNND